MKCAIQNPTTEAYSEMTTAFDWFNTRLFNNELPPCLITLVKKKRTRGYYHAEIFYSENGTKADEIAMNPEAYADRTDAEALSTLVHEMCHLWQYHFGKRPRRAYHDKEWAAKMESIGLMPSNTGQPGGKKTGDQMTHYIMEGEAFDHNCAQLFKTGFKLSYRSKQDNGKKNKSNRSKYTCACDTSVWGKPGLIIHCNECEENFEETI